MSGYVLAVLVPGADVGIIHEVASVIAELLDTDVRDYRLPGALFAAASERSRTALVRESRAAGAVGVVLNGPGHPSGAMRLVSQIDCPIVYVPASTATPFVLRRILVPLDGSRDAADAVTETVALARGHAVDIVVLHCTHGGSLPLFEDRPQYDTPEWAREFAARHPVALTTARLELRVGAPSEQVIDVTRSIAADLVVLGWSRHPAPGRALTVRALLARSIVPVMLVPVTSGA
jgi:hypothetical protein